MKRALFIRAYCADYYAHLYVEYSAGRLSTLQCREGVRSKRAEALRFWRKYRQSHGRPVPSWPLPP